MSFVDVLNEVQSLPRVDKLRLIQFLAQELADREGALVEEAQSYPIWSPDQAFAAADTLLQVLRTDRGSTT